MSYFTNLGKSILPERIRVHIKHYLKKTGTYDVPFDLYGKIFMFSFIISIIIYGFFLFPKLKSQNLVYMILASFISLSAIEFALVTALAFIMWMNYEFIIFRRTLKIEEVLPDFLQQVSINLRAGMSFDKALWNSLAPEYGVLEKEIEIVAKKVMSGEDTEEALKEFSEKYDSLLLQESLDMVIIGLRGGGNISSLIDKIVENVKDAYYLRKELIAEIMSYVIFISITAVLISPTLFALSFNLMQIIQGLGEKLTTSSDSLPFSLGFKSINPEDFILFSKLSIVIIAAISSMIIADLREGSIKAGIKYIIIFIPIAYLVYTGMLTAFSGLFGALS